MKRGTLVLVLLAALAPGRSAAQTFPVVRGALELEIGVGAVVLPEDTPGTFSAQPTGRVGYFLLEGIEAQAEVSYRVWPLGSVAPKSLSVSGNLLWYPNLGPGNRNLYFLGGLGAASSDPPKGETSTDALIRGAVGYKVPLGGFLKSWHFGMEFRGEFLPGDTSAFVSGALGSFSYFL